MNKIATQNFKLNTTISLPAGLAGLGWCGETLADRRLQHAGGTLSSSRVPLKSLGSKAVAKVVMNYMSKGVTTSNMLKTNRFILASNTLPQLKGMLHRVVSLRNRFAAWISYTQSNITIICEISYTNYLYGGGVARHQSLSFDMLHLHVGHISAPIMLHATFSYHTSILGPP